MAKSRVNIRDYSGGIATVGQRKDKQFTARFIKNLDIHSSPDYLTLSKKPTKVSGNTVTDLIFWMVDGSPYDTNRYFYDLSGKIYRETSADAWSSLKTVSGGSGEGLAIFDDYLYYALATDLGRYGKLSGTPVFDDTLTNWWDVTDIQDSGGGTGATDYSTTTAINEGATHRQTFTANHDPLKEITIDVDVVGTGDWTITVHDEFNTLIGTATIANASMSTGDVTFTFATLLRLVIGNPYHFHVTTTVADGGVDTDANNNLEGTEFTEGAEFTVEYGVLIDSEFHPIVVVEDKIIIGNDSYIAVFDQVTYDPNKILLEKGFKVRTITKVDEYVVVGCYKGDTVDTAEESRTFIWDTIAPSFNIAYDTTSIGAPNALTNNKNTVLGVWGNTGGLYQGLDPAQKIFNAIPGLSRGKTLNIYPSAITNMDGTTLIGVSGVTNDATGLEQGVYAYGTRSSFIPDGLSLAHLVSTGTTKGTTLKIGMVHVVGDEIYYSWRDGSTYGVDRIKPDALAATSGVYESLMFDADDNDKTKLAIEQVTRFEELASGETITNKIKYERGSFTDGTAATESSKRAKDGQYKRFKELETGFTLASSGGTFPKVTQHTVFIDTLEEEKYNE